MRASQPLTETDRIHHFPEGLMTQLPGAGSGPRLGSRLRCRERWPAWMQVSKRPPHAFRRCCGGWLMNLPVVWRLLLPGFGNN